MTVTSFNNRCWVWLLGFVFSTTALAQSAAIDPNDPVVKTLRDAEASELLPLKDHCLEKYPQLATSLETQLTARLQTMYGPDYPVKVKKFAASRDFKESRPGTLTVFKAWPEAVQKSRCENLPPSMVYEPAFIDMYRQGLEENLATLTEYVRACNTLYPGEKFSQRLLEEQIEHVYGEGAQAQRKYAAFLNTPKTNAMLADRLEVFNQQRGDKSYRLLSQCFSNERRASGEPLPAKVAAPTTAPKPVIQ